MIVKKIILCTLVSTLLQYAEPSRILCVYPSPSKSHLLVAKPLMVELANRGHEVTMVSSYPLAKPIPNYRDIYYPLEGLLSGFIKNFAKKGQSMFTQIPQVLKANLDGANATLNNPEFQKVMQEEEFDLVIIGFFMNDFILGIGAHFRCPIVGIWSAGAGKFLNDFVGNPTETAAVPNMFLGNKNPMTFKDRVVNFVFNGLETVGVSYVNYKNKQYYDSMFPSDKYPSFEEVKKNVSLVLLNTHFTQGILRPYVQNMVEVGGLQIKKKASPLPDDIQKWLDGAESGAILLSFGSNLKFSEFPEEKINAFIEAISKLKQRVLLKLDTDELKNKPDNVMIGKWLPQDDILAHKNVKLFISHGGLGSVAEAKYHGVPLIGIPVYADQDTNIKIVEEEGWGCQIDLGTLTAEKLTEAMNKILNDPSYAANVKELSLLYRDRPLPALDLAVFWVEYVIRHKGARHMRYQGVDLNFFQSTSLDVILFLAVVIYIVYLIFKIIAKTLLSLICRRKKQKTQ